MADGESAAASVEAVCYATGSVCSGVCSASVVGSVYDVYAAAGVAYCGVDKADGVCADVDAASADVSSTDGVCYDVVTGC